MEIIALINSLIIFKILAKRYKACIFISLSNYLNMFWQERLPISWGRELSCSLTEKYILFIQVFKKCFNFKNKHVLTSTTIKVLLELSRNSPRKIIGLLTVDLRGISIVWMLPRSPCLGAESSSRKRLCIFSVIVRCLLFIVSNI